MNNAKILLENPELYFTDRKEWLIEEIQAEIPGFYTYEELNAKEIPELEEIGKKINELLN